MNANERLAEVFDRGLRIGVDELSLTDRDLFQIQSFIIDFEMGGLSGYLYNRLPDLQDIRATVAALRRFRLPRLAELLNEVVELFTEYVDPDPLSTWGEVLKRYDPAEKLDQLYRQIAELDDYGLRESSIH